MSVTVRVNNSSNADTITIYNAADSAQLTGFSTLQLRANHTTATRRFAATAVLNGNQIVITVGAIASGTTLTPTGTVTMRWAPSNAVRDLAGNAGSTATVNESGTADRDF